MSYNVLFKTTLSSIIHNNEICDELIKIGKEQNYPITKAKFYKKLEKYVGFGEKYMVTAKKLPPIPGGWDVEIISFEPQERHIMVNVSLIERDGKIYGEVNKLVLRMLDEYKKEGLNISIDAEHKEFYGNPVRQITAIGHPILLELLEEFIEDMR